MIINKYVFLLVSSVVIASFSQIFLKKSTKKQYDSIIQEYLNPYVITGYGMLVISTIVTILAYKGLEYKNGPVIESVGYILIMVLSRIFFKEKITVQKVIGNGLILVGILIFYL